jgi:hypothetical protein
MQPMEPGEAEKFRIHYVKITNHGDIAFTDRHDGVPVTIEPGKWDNLPLDMAKHFFGYDYGVPKDVMFRHVCKRQGWNTPAHLARDETGKTLAERLFEKLDIQSIVYKMVEEKVDTDAPIPADPQPPEVAKEAPPAPPKSGKTPQGKKYGDWE